MAAAAAAVVVFHRNKLPIYLHLSDVVFVAVWRRRRLFLSNCALIRHSPIDLPILSCSSAAATASAGPTYAVLHILRGGRHNVLLGPVGRRRVVETFLGRERGLSSATRQDNPWHARFAVY